MTWGRGEGGGAGGRGGVGGGWDGGDVGGCVAGERVMGAATVCMCVWGGGSRPRGPGTAYACHCRI